MIYVRKLLRDFFSIPFGDVFLPFFLGLEFCGVFRRRARGPCFQQLTLLFAVCSTKVSACGHTWIYSGLVQGFFRVACKFALEVMRVGLRLIEGWFGVIEGWLRAI